MLKITVSQWPFSDQIQYLTEQNLFYSDKFTEHFQRETFKGKPVIFH